MLSGVKVMKNFLTLLDPDARRAEEKYIELFRKLARFFEWSRVDDPEGLAQESIARAFQRLREGQSVHAADPTAYFFGFARNVLREHRRVPRPETIVTDDIAPPRISFERLNATEEAVLLRECLEKIPKDEFALLLSYVEGDRTALERGDVSPGSLRVRVHRIRKRLESQLLRSTSRLKQSGNVPRV